MYSQRNIKRVFLRVVSNMWTQWTSHTVTFAFFCASWRVCLPLSQTLLRSFLYIFAGDLNPSTRNQDTFRSRPWNSGITIFHVGYRTNIHHGSQNAWASTSGTWPTLLPLLSLTNTVCGLWWSAGSLAQVKAFPGLDVLMKTWWPFTQKCFNFASSTLYPGPTQLSVHL